MRLALISDVHGNRHALEAVLEDVARQDADGLINLGDHLSGPLDPAGTATLLMAAGGLAIRGNHDRVLLETGAPDFGPIDEFALARLEPHHLDWLRSLPATASWGEQVFVCHGTPQSDSTFWLEDYWTQRHTRLPDEAQVAAPAQGLAFPVLCCGHTHLSRTVRLRDGRCIVNPGSVGLQLVHGSPDARYGLIEERGESWSVTFRAIPYDHEGAARLATANGYPLWAEALRSGWANPEGLF